MGDLVFITFDLRQSELFEQIRKVHSTETVHHGAKREFDVFFWEHLVEDVSRRDVNPEVLEARIDFFDSGSEWRRLNLIL